MPKLAQKIALAGMGGWAIVISMLALISAMGIWPECASAQSKPDPRVADLVQAGKLRVGLGVVAGHWAIKDSATGELRGVAVDLAKALGQRLGIEFVPVEYPSPPKILDGLQTNAWDVGFLGVDPSRAALVDFSPPYLQIEATYLVPASSSIRNIAEADKSGVRIAVANNSVEEIALKRIIKHAELRNVDTLPAGFDLLRAGVVEALAAPRPTLLLFASRLPGSRVLDEPFHATFAAMVVPKGQAARLAYISEFVEEAKTSGLVQQAIEHVGVRGVQAVPPGKPAPQ
jgi:polar amino acid transport system substrate-binding protein